MSEKMTVAVDALMRIERMCPATQEMTVAHMMAQEATDALEALGFCRHCDGTGDVHSIDGEWRGRCTCPAGRAALEDSK